MFVVLVLLFGSPPPVSLHRLSRRPLVALVATAQRRDADPLALGGPGDPQRLDAASPTLPGWWGPPRRDAQAGGRTFHPVKAA
ncbi:MAG TPA: hypothetical protein PKD53_28540 [Chloroflexaceae bacterium]|nr:hypothetical protein [Chloroflexaceae bacterium]